jgi:hypothetical protein
MQSATTGSTDDSVMASTAGMLSFGASLHDVAISVITAATTIIVSIFFIFQMLLRCKDTPFLWIEEKIFCRVRRITYLCIVILAKQQNENKDHIYSICHMDVIVWLQTEFS